MPDDPDPPRKFYGFKPTQFEQVNPVRPPAPGEEPPTSPSPTPDAVRDTPIDIRELVRQGAQSGPVLKGNAPANRANEVHEILRDNLARADAAGLNDVKPVAPRKSRRKRDYFLSLLAGNAFFIWGLTLNPVFAGAGLVLFNVGLTWVMWVVMDDY
jgi:hypothetical protein